MKVENIEFRKRKNVVFCYVCSILSLKRFRIYSCRFALIYNFAKNYGIPLYSSDVEMHSDIIRTTCINRNCMQIWFKHVCKMEKKISFGLNWPKNKSKFECHNIF